MGQDIIDQCREVKDVDLCTASSRRQSVPSIILIRIQLILLILSV